MHYLLFYEKALDYLERQIPLQEAHKEHVFAAMNRGDILMAGNLGNPDGAALILFHGEQAAISFAKNDPYVVHGVIASWYIRPWDTLPAGSQVESASVQKRHV